MNVDTLHVYWDTDHRHRWTFFSDNGQIIADSGQGYADKRDALHGFAILNRAQVTGPALYEDQFCGRHRGGPQVCHVWQLARRDLEHVIADALRETSLKCPVHGIPDCSPLLNGCQIPYYLRNQLDLLAQTHDARSFTR